MKNVHVLTTSQPSRLVKNNLGLIRVTDNFTQSDLDFIQAEFVNIYITSDEVKKNGEWVLSNLNEIVKFCSLYCQNSYKKIILTTNQDLIKNSVQAIDDEFLQWFVKNPSCEEVDIKIKSTLDKVDGHYHDLWKIIIPKEEPKQVWEQIIETCGGKEEFMKSAGLLPKQETLEEAVEKLKSKELFKESNDRARKILSEIKSLPIQERMYSEEEVQVKLYECLGHFAQKHNIIINGSEIDQWFEQYKKK